MLSHVPKSGHFLDYLNFGALFDFFLWSICWNLCNLALVKCLLNLSLPNLYKLNIFKWSNYGTKGVDHWVTYPRPTEYWVVTGLKKVLISQWLVTLIHICGVIPKPVSPVTPCNRRCLRIERRYRHIKWRVFKSFGMFHNVLSVSWCFTSGSRCITMYHNFLHVFHDVSLCLTMFYNV